MSCEGCAKDVSDSLYKLDGIAKVEANLKDQLVRVEGTGTPPKLSLFASVYELCPTSAHVALSHLKPILRTVLGTHGLCHQQ